MSLITCTICMDPVCDGRVHIIRRSVWGDRIPANPLYPRRCWWFYNPKNLQDHYPQEDFHPEDFGLRSGPNLSQEQYNEACKNLALTGED